jgi:hypothetical protein
VDLYTFSLLLGAAGLGAMALLGFSHHSAGGRTHGHSHSGPSHGATHAHGHGHGSHGHGHSTSHHPGIKESASRTLWALLSPRILFSVVLGLGTTGLLLKSVLSGLPLLALALIGGVLFERILVGPLWNLAMRFSSTPALMLESCVSDEATAVTTFDANGQGLVAVELDGQVIQVLGTLQAVDRAAGVRVRAGDRVRIEEVNSERNRCTVSAL